MENAFLSFYEEHRERLTEKINHFNGSLRDEPDPVLRPFFEDFADLNEGGKLLRGVLVWLGYFLGRSEQAIEHLSAEEAPVPTEIDKIDALAMAFELFQTAVLVHDDIIDHAALRRGKETMHVRCSDRIAEKELQDRAGDTPASAALCAGDYGLYAANRLIAEAFCDDPRLGKLLLSFDEVVMDTIRGELLDVVLPVEMTDPALSSEEKAKQLAGAVSRIYHLKTARYSVIGPLTLGMIAAGASAALLASAERFGTYAGAAFQMKDDIFGIYAEEAQLGKDAGADIAEAKLTILYQYVTEYAPEYLWELNLYYGKAPVTEEAIHAVQRIFRESGALAFAEGRMQECFSKAKRQGKAMPVGAKEKAWLGGFLAYLETRNK